MKKLLFIFGTRPEAIKLAPVINKFKEHKSEYAVKICVTAQHREMLDQVLKIFDLKPDFDLNIMRQKQSLEQGTSNVQSKLKLVLEREKPDLVFVQGDTASVMAASLSCFYQKIKIAHVEAGLRTNDKYSPFPEEMNRKITGVLADIHFAPTATAKENLLKENVKVSSIYITGNTVVDALLEVAGKVKKTKASKYKELKKINFSRKIVLITGHRRESFGQGFVDICESIRTLAGKHLDVEFVYPVHLNPHVQRPVKEMLGHLKNVKLIAPLSYLPFVYLMSRSHIILTDSGGIQEEAPSLGKPVLVMREKTERPEAVKAGTVKLVGTDKKKIIRECSKLIKNKWYYGRMAKIHNPYGDGKAAEKIVQIVNKLMV